jgi:pimeloyl-ACP methyl ester carboxylesterase
LQNSQLMIFNRCGHWVQLEQANMFNAMVDAFLSLDHHASKTISRALGG